MTSGTDCDEKDMRGCQGNPSVECLVEGKNISVKINQILMHFSILDNLMPYNTLNLFSFIGFLC